MTLTAQTLARIGTAVPMVHIADDSFLHPQSGTSAIDHLAGGLIPLALLGAAMYAFPRMRGGALGGWSLVIGFFSLVAAAEALHYTRNGGPTGDDFTGLLCIPAGLLLAGLGAATLWRSRRLDGMPRRYGRRAAKSLAGLAVAMLVLFPIGFSYVATHAARAFVPAPELGAAHERVAFETEDGLTLRGWYVPSRNGAAVIAFPGRRGPQAPARVLARHGYGVLVFDRRGEGISDGDPNSFGWGGDQDVLAAARFLEARPDVDPGRVGGVGLSVGGEMMLETAAETDALAAVVSEGAGTRTFSEDVDEFEGFEKLISLPFLAFKTASVAVFSNTAPPPKLMDLMPRIDEPVLLIHNGRQGEDLNHEYFRALRSEKSEWLVRESGHTGASRARPREYEQRLVGFFDGALGVDR
jgi:dienelactone hydrolase